MKTFVTSDTHFGHANIIKYCNRPFEDVRDMNLEMARTWNYRVSESDEIYFLGDFAMGPGVDEAFIVDMLERLNGKKFIVLGNHDQPSRKHKMVGLRRAADYFNNIAILSDIYELRFEGTNFVMSHYPMSDWNGKFHGSIHLHGHQHNQFSEEQAAIQVVDKRYDVGVDMYGGPVQLTGDLRFLKYPRGWTND
jgi:calcineurin-like phosphoesterase family protein